jgi:hypothetical protein
MASMVTATTDTMSELVTQVLAHTITINGDGENEARPRNISILVMIRAY